MKPTEPAQNSWKMFWGFSAVLIPSGTLLSTTTLWVKYPETHPSFGRSLVLGLVATLGLAGLGLIDRSISGRNRLGVFFVLAICPVVANRPDLLPLTELVRGECLILLYMAPFVILISTISRFWTRRTSKRKLSPLADPEIDARPLA